MHVSAHLDVDVVALESDDDVTLMLELVAPAADHASTDRAEHTAVVVLDRSGSMNGDRLDATKTALAGLVGKLDDRDRFGLVTFDDTAQVVIPAAKVADTGRDRLLRRIQQIQAGGMTDLSAGYFRGLQEARRVCTTTGATVVLLSDGHANSGVTESAKLRQVAARAGRQAITTSTIGIGTGYDDEILADLAGGGQGNHAFAADGDAAAQAVAQEIDGLLAKTVQAAHLIVKPQEDVTGVAILNDLLTQRVERGVMAELGDLYAGETRRLLIKLGVPCVAALGLAQIAELELSYVSLPDLTQHTVTLPVQVNIVPADVAAGRVRDPLVVVEELFVTVQKSKRDSLQALQAGDVDAARTSLADGLSRLEAAPPSEVLRSERVWLRRTLDGLEEDREYTSKRVRSDMSRKMRGSIGRTIGGEITVDSEQGDDERGEDDSVPGMG